MVFCVNYVTMVLCLVTLLSSLITATFSAGQSFIFKKLNSYIGKTHIFPSPTLRKEKSIMCICYLQHSTIWGTVKITDQIVSCIFYGFNLFTDFSETWCDGSKYMVSNFYNSFTGS